MLKAYLHKQDLHTEAISLFIHHFIRFTGTGLLGIFGPIYVYQQYGRIEPVLIYNGAIFLAVFLLSPFAMKIINRLGFKKAMIIALFLLCGLYVAFYFAGTTSFTTFWFAISGTLHALQIVLYWVPYHTDFTLLTNPKTRSRSLAVLKVCITLVAIILPIAASAIITTLGFGVLFAITIAMILYSLFFLKKVPDITEKFSFGIWQTFTELFKKKHRNILVAYSADAAQGLVGAVVWPVFIFILLDGNFFSVGFVTALIVFATVILQLVVGDLADHLSKSKLVKLSSVFHALGWVVKSIVQTPFQIFAAGTYHDLTKSATEMSFESLMYEQAGSIKHFVDEYSVLRQMAQSVGRVMIMILALALLQFMGIESLFWVAAIASLFLGFL